jgi:3-phosphoshikimate 1-carboxyvinyltransferase
MTVGGSARLSKRPHGPLLDALSALGCAITGGPELPVTVHGPIGGGKVAIDGSVSSQFLSALLLVAPRLKDGLRLSVLGSPVSSGYSDLTVAFMARFGVPVGNDLAVREGPYKSADIEVEADWSGATILLAVAPVLGIPVFVPHLKTRSLQPDRAFADFLIRLGVEVEEQGEGVVASGMVKRGGEFDGSMIPDAIPALLTLGALCSVPLSVHRIGHLRAKESDRLDALATILRAQGAVLSESSDGLRVESGIRADLSAEVLEIDAQGDHRMAMAAALTGLLRPIRLTNSQVVSKSFPGFFEQWPGATVEAKWRSSDREPPI